MTSPVSAALVAAAVAVLAGTAAGQLRREVVTRRVRRRFAGARPTGDVTGGSPVRRWFGGLARSVSSGSRQRRSEAELLEWVDGATRIVRSGGSLRHALIGGVGSPTASPELVQLRDDLLDAAPLSEALARFEARHRSPSGVLAARSISLAGETGGRPAHLLESVGFTVRERLECGREARALATQARSSAVVIMVAPLAFAVVGAGADGRVAAFLFGSVGGLACIGGGLLLEAIGCVWMARLVGRIA